ncbi:hypothetical protein H0H93_007410, partial [Arthromyces matolae]
KRPLPVAPTGYYDWQTTIDTSDDYEGHSKITNAITRVSARFVIETQSLTIIQFQSFQSKGGFKPNLAQVDAFLDATRHPTAIDDRKGALTAGLEILARLDPNSDTAKKMNNDVIKMFYESVPHPPASFMGARHAFRNADGSGNNLQNPDLGRAGTAYARSVQGTAGLPRTSLPDPGIVYDSILKRKGVKHHEGGMSSMIFAFASIVTHSVFRTDPRDTSINNASSYLDLSPVYGDNQAAQDKVRDKASGRGLLFPDAFSEERLLFLPPAASVLLVLFSRNHNYIAERILKINERKRWTEPPPSDSDKLARQDEEIFQTARLINCGHFMSTVMGDYVTSFLGASEGSDWNMNAFDVGLTDFSSTRVIKTKEVQVDRGLGNHVSIEFNLLYRWHATLSEKDLEWTEGVFREVFGDKPFEELSIPDLASVATKLTNILPNPAERTFGGLKRGADGRFADDDLANILYSATETPAGSFRGRGTPTVLRVVEILSLEQSRAWGVCTMNEFRKFLGLKTFRTFEEWNPDPEIATGLQAEATMPLSHNFRFACGYTTTRSILADAVALVRGDRFYTSDFTPANLTTWGFHDCQRDMQNGGLGGQIPKLLLRHLPRHFPWNSVYTLYPLFTPEKMRDSLTRQNLQPKYSFEHPKIQPIVKVVKTFTGIKKVFGDPSLFKTVYEKKGYGSILMFDDIAKYGQATSCYRYIADHSIKRHDSEKAMVVHALFPHKESLAEHAAWFAASITAKIKERSWK